jgi:copper chaperone, putative
MEGVSDVAVDLEKQIAHVTTDKFYSASDYEAALAKTIYRVLDVAEAE